MTSKTPGTCLLALLLATVATGTFGQSTVRDARLVNRHDPSIVEIELEGTYALSTFALREPDRFVVDLSGVILPSPRTLAVDSTSLLRVRMAQYQGGAYPVARFVFDLAAMSEPTVEEESQLLRLTFAAPDSRPTHRAVEQTDPAAPVEIQLEPVPTPDPIGEPETTSGQTTAQEPIRVDLVEVEEPLGLAPEASQLAPQRIAVAEQRAESAASDATIKDSRRPGGAADPPDSTSNRIILKNGKYVETRGAWHVDAQGRRVVYTTPEGMFASLRVEEVDLERSREPTQRQRPEKKPLEEKQEAPVLVLSSQGGAVYTEREATGLKVDSWRQRSTAEGLVLEGTVLNQTDYRAFAVRVTAKLYDDQGALVDEREANLERRTMAVGERVRFAVRFAPNDSYERVSFQVVGSRG